MDIINIFNFEFHIDDRYSRGGEVSLLERRKKRVFVIILLGLALTINLTAKQLGYYGVAGVSVLLGTAVSLAWIVETIIDNKQENQK